MGSNPAEYLKVLSQLQSYNNVPQPLISSLQACVSQLEQQNKFRKPMPWIGVYIALASLLCMLAMVADLVHGLRNRKLWFPCKYFTINAASLSVMAVAMKLPMDLNNPMPGVADQAAKLVSMAFMSTMMANFLPSLGPLDNKELLTNIMALGVLVITLVVNVCIQIKTGLVSHTEPGHLMEPKLHIKYSSHYNKSVAIIYATMLLFLLVIHASTALAIVTSKGILEPKYPAGHKSASKHQELQQPTVEKLKQHVSKYWLMTRTGNPQFLTACSASGVICVFSTVVHIIVMLFTYGFIRDHRSDYKWSVMVILITQSTGVVLGSIAPLFRCFAALSFKLSKKWIWDHIKIFRVENYWTRKLSDLEHSSIPFSCSSRKCKIVVQNLKVLTLGFCIGFQKTVLVACKTIGLVPVFIVICVLCCVRCWKWLKAMFADSSVVVATTPEQHETNEDLGRYVLLLENMELAERTMKGISNSVDRLIRKAEKQQPNNLMKLLQGSRGFEGVGRYDSHHVPPFLLEGKLLEGSRGFEGVERFDGRRLPPLLLEGPFDCWSLPVVTLTSIAIAFPNIQSDMVGSLLSSVSEGLVYVALVEESLNSQYDYVCVQKTAKALWLEVEVYHKWLGNRLASPANTARGTLQWLSDAAKEVLIAMEVESLEDGQPNESCFGRLISANSMYRITQTILLSYHGKIDEVIEEQLFGQVSSMIADILAACLTNLPRVIAMRCYANRVEPRVTTVDAAAQLLGETMQIIDSLEDRELPNLNPDEMAFIEKWRACLQGLFLP